MSVYFIQAEDGGPIKIGWATDPLERCKDLQCSHHAVLVVRATINGPRALEGQLHKRFKAHRLSGEWFAPVSEIAEMGGCIADDEKVKKQRARRRSETETEMAALLSSVLAIPQNRQSEESLSLQETLHLARLIGSPEASRGWTRRDLDDEMYLPVLEITIAYLVAIGEPASRIKPLRARLRNRKQQVAWMRKRERVA